MTPQKTFFPPVVSPVALGIVVLSLLAAFAIFYLYEPVIVYLDGDDGGRLPNDKTVEALIDQLTFMTVIALFIERSVETYLVASGLHEDRVVDGQSRTEYRFRPIAPYAMTVGVVLSALVVVAGVRLLDVAIDYRGEAPGQSAEQNQPIGIADGNDDGNDDGDDDAKMEVNTFLIGAADIVLSVGLLSAGATVLHGIVNLIPELARRAQGFVTGTDLSGRYARTKVLVGSPAELEHMRTAVTAQAQAVRTAAQHSIRIDRGPGSTGVLYFRDGAQTMDFPCRWDPYNRIEAGTFPRGSRTLQPPNQQAGIHIPGARLNGKANDAIHIASADTIPAGTGSFILDPADLAQLLAAIPDANAFNITVTVRDI
ncbi:MAG: hypothetical protein AAF222_00450 [Pseudomonadota bacterium]